MALLLGAGASPLAAEASPFAPCEADLVARPDRYDSSFCFYEVARSEKLWDEARRRLEGHLAESPGNHWLRLALGHIAWVQGSASAEGFYRAAAQGFARQGNADGEVIARFNLRDFLFQRGRSKEAGAEVDRALRAAQRSGRPLPLARAEVLRAQHLADTGGDLGDAYRRLRLAEAALPSDAPYRLRRDCLGALAATSYGMGRLTEALRQYRRLEALVRVTGDTFALAAVQYDIANTLLEERIERPRKGGREEVLRLARVGLGTAHEAGNLRVEVHLLRMVANLLSGSEEGRLEASRDLQRCRALAEEAGQSDQVVACGRARASHLLRWDPAAAEPLIEEAIARAEALGDPRALARARRVGMKVRWRLGPRTQAIAESAAALAAIEALRDRQGSDSVRAGLFSAWTRPYYWFSGRLLQEAREGAGERGEVALAFSVTERLRGRVLLEALARADSTSGRRAAAPAATAPLDRLRESLRPTEALLSFQLAPWEDIYGDFAGGSWLLVVTRRGTRAYPLPDRSVLEPAVRALLGLVERRDGSERAAGARLHRALLSRPLEDLPPGVEDLVIVPDGALHRLPFAALRASVDGPALGIRYRLSVAPSATLWLRWRQDPAEPPEAAALALADPAPPGSEGWRTVALQRGWSLLRGPGLGALPYARREGRLLVRHLGRSSRLLMGREATEHLLEHADVQRFGVLHLAAHAVVDEERPDRSAVLLAAGPGSEDGLLRPREIAQLDLTGRVVVLSACRSASGTLLRGEGVLGLARAFFEAGAHAVVGSLWPLRDDEAAALFDRFYLHLARGESVSGALATAQSDRQRAGAPAAAWAGVVALGDGELVPFPGGIETEGLRRRPALMAILLIAVLVAATLLLRRRRS